MDDTIGRKQQKKHHDAAMNDFVDTTTFIVLVVVGMSTLELLYLAQYERNYIMLCNENRLFHSL